MKFTSLCNRNEIHILLWVCGECLPYPQHCASVGVGQVLLGGVEHGDRSKFKKMWGRLGGSVGLLI